MYGELKVFSCSSGRHLLDSICKLLSIEPGKALIGRFNYGEIRIEIQENVRSKDVFILASTHPPAENILEAMLFADAACRSSAQRITLVISYLGYNRQDRKDRPRVSVSAWVIAESLSRSIDRVLLFDTHAETTAAFFGPEVGVDHLYASPIFIPYLRKIVKDNFVIASPDRGGTNRAVAYANRLSLSDCVVFTKYRSEAGKINGDMVKVIGDVKNKDVIFVDDLIDTAGTLSTAAQKAKEEGALNIYACAAHGLFSGEAISRLNKSPIKEVIVTNSINHQYKLKKAKVNKIKVLDVAPLLAKAIRRIHEEQSISSLINSEQYIK